MTEQEADGQSMELKALTDAGIKRHRMTDFKVMVESADGTRCELPDGAEIEIELKEHAFRFGVCLPNKLVSEAPEDLMWQAPFKQFVESHFNTVVCENAMKWYANCPDGPQHDYAVADRLLDYAESKRLEMRGHCLFWDREKFVQKWLLDLKPEALADQINARLNSVIPQFGSRVSCWDVMNEMLDGGFFSDRLGSGIYPEIFRKANALNPNLPLFVNEFALVGSKEKTSRYLALIERLIDQGAPLGGIGIQEHACERILASGDALTAANETIERVELAPVSYHDVVQTLDAMSEVGLPIHLTEISAKSLDEERRAAGLEALYRIGFSHPGVELILLWGFWENSHWLGRAAALADSQWNILPAGQRLDQLINHEWHTRGNFPVEQGHASFTGFHGRYHVLLRLPNGRQFEHELMLNRDSPVGVITLGQ